MQLVNEFVVPRGVDETWAVLTDVERIAPAMPGAQLTEVTPDGKYHGNVKVKVGPVTAKYGGVASFRELDPANHHMVLDATGKESSGRGRASALISADLVPEGAETRVKVSTDLTISGPLAQFGRGAIAEVSSRLLNQFVTNLKEMVLADTPAPSSAPPSSGQPGSDQPGSAPHSPAAGPAAAGSAAANSAAGPSAGSAGPGSAGSDGGPVMSTGSTPAPVSSLDEPSSVAEPAPDQSVLDQSVPDRSRLGQSAPDLSGPDHASEARSSASAASPGPDAGGTSSAAQPVDATASTPAPPARPAAKPSADAAEVNLLKVAAWPILKRAIPLLIVIAVIVILLVWWLG